MPIQLGYVASTGIRYATGKLIRRSAAYQLEGYVAKRASKYGTGNIYRGGMGLNLPTQRFGRFDLYYQPGESPIFGSKEISQYGLTGILRTHRGLLGEVNMNLFKGPWIGKGSIGSIHYDIYKSYISGTLSKRYQIGIASILRSGDNPMEPQKPNLSGGLVGLHNKITNTLGQSANGLKPNISVDTSRFDAAMREYIRYSRKDLTTIVNQKLYWVCINAISNTYKADKSMIDAGLDSPSNKFNGLSIAETLAVLKARKEGRRLTKTELTREANKIKRQRRRAIGFLRSGWIPAIRIMAPHAEVKSAVGRSERMSKKIIGQEKGTALPALKSMNSDVVVASAFNNIIADNNPKAQQYMQVGLQIALNKEAASMMQYVNRKIQKNNNRFNSRR